MKLPNWLINSGRGFLALIIYFGMSLFKYLPFNLLNIDMQYVSPFLITIYSVAFEILMIALIFIIYRKLIEEKWKDMCKNHKEYFNKYFKYWFLLIGLMMISNFIILLITNDTVGAENQNQIIEMFTKAPIYTYISAVIFAPIVEELIFRQAIRSIIPKFNVLFILVSGFIFGGMHVIGANNLAQILYIIPYSIPGLIFAYVLTKSNNIFTTIGLHFFHNGLLMAIQALIFIFA